ncbi:MAG: hypothetical protein ACKO9Q_12275, partial [Pirellula sp.]
AKTLAFHDRLCEDFLGLLISLWRLHFPGRNQGFAADCSLTAKEPFASNGKTTRYWPLSRIGCCKLSAKRVYH